MTGFFAALRARLRDLLHRANEEQDLQDELQAHIESDARWLASRGHSPDDARRMARARLGGMDAVADSTRETWGGPSLAEAWHYTRLGARALRRSPLFTGASILTLVPCPAGPR